MGRRLAPHHPGPDVLAPLSLTVAAGRPGSGTARLPSSLDGAAGPPLSPKEGNQQGPDLYTTLKAGL